VPIEKRDVMFKSGETFAASCCQHYRRHNAHPLGGGWKPS
jgi:hypothetical protein